MAGQAQHNKEERTPSMIRLEPLHIDQKRWVLGGLSAAGFGFLCLAAKLFGNDGIEQWFAGVSTTNTSTPQAILWSTARWRSCLPRL